MGDNKHLPTPRTRSSLGKSARVVKSYASSSAFSISAKPDEDWTKIKDLAIRRKIQNRIAQRNYRLKQRIKLRDLESLASASLLPAQSKADIQYQQRFEQISLNQRHHEFPVSPSRNQVFTGVRERNISLTTPLQSPPPPPVVVASAASFTGYQHQFNLPEGFPYPSYPQAHLNCLPSSRDEQYGESFLPMYYSPLPSAIMDDSYIYDNLNSFSYEYRNPTYK